jgi:plasmid stabilization system protein ParE
MLKPVIWSPSSENDFANILDYLNANWGYQVSINFIDITENILDQISHNPRQYPFSYKRRKIRKCVLTKHNTLYYRESKFSIEILRIFDTRQNPNTLTFN